LLLLDTPVVVSGLGVADTPFVDVDVDPSGLMLIDFALGRVLPFFGVCVCLYVPLTQLRGRVGEVHRFPHHQVEFEINIRAE
jgi:hypothetical protein